MLFSKLIVSLVSKGEPLYLGKDALVSYFAILVRYLGVIYSRVSYTLTYYKFIRMCYRFRYLRAPCPLVDLGHTPIR